MLTVPEWFNTELERVGASCAWAKWGRKNYVIPVTGMPFWRSVRTPEGRLVDQGTPGSFVEQRYDGLHHERRNIPFRMPDRFVTPGRLVIFQPVPTPAKYERILDLVDEVGELVPVTPMLLSILAQRRDAWDRVDAEQAARDSARKQAEEQAEEETLAACKPGDAKQATRGALDPDDIALGENLLGELVDRLVTSESRNESWSYQNDPKQPTAPSFKVIDKRHRFAARETEPAPPAPVGT